jgi:hypothetical protein
MNDDDFQRSALGALLEAHPGPLSEPELAAISETGSLQPMRSRRSGATVWRT